MNLNKIFNNPQQAAASKMNQQQEPAKFDPYNYDQAKRNATVKTNQYLKKNGHTYAKVNCSRGIFILTNGSQFFTAAELLTQATGYKFTAINTLTAKLDKSQF